MSIPIDPTPPKGNWKAALGEAVKALSKGLSQDYLEAGKSAYDAFVAFRATQETPEQRVWTLWRESLSLALEDFFKTGNLYRRPTDSEEFRRILQGVLEQSAKIAQSGNAALNAANLSTPTDFPLYRALREQVPQLASAVAPDHGEPVPALQRRLDRSYQRSFHAAWTRGFSHFKPLGDTFEGPVGEAVRREEHWERYYKHLAWQVEEDPLFGQDKNGPALADIFVPLRCYWREYLPRPSPIEINVDRKVTAHIDWLSGELRRWLDEADKNDTLRVVTGGPGSGKSSSAKILARDIARAGDYNIYFVSLHGLDVSNSIEQIVDSHTQTFSISAGSLPESPLNWLRTEYKPLLLIFDGLDEVARPDREGPDVTRKFVGSLRDWLRTANSGSDLKVKALTLGRPRAAEDAADEISLADRALIHVAPLSVLTEEMLKRHSDTDFAIVDPSSLCELEQRVKYWKNWSALARLYPKEPPQGLFEEDLRDLTVEPLLLYLLIYSGYLGENWKEAAENRNRIYEAIFRKVHERDVKQKGHALKEGLKDEAGFFTLMECLGLAAWRGGGRTGDTAHFERLRDSIYAPERVQDFKGVGNADLDNVALQFYTRRTGGEQPGYTFIHKSFGEYLAGRALIEAAEKWLDDYRRRSRPEIFASDWLKLAGELRITSEMPRFMAEEARLRVKRNADDEADSQGARERTEVLCKIIGWVLRNGFPACGDLGGDNVSSSRRRREQIQRNAEEALYMLIQVWADVAYPTYLLNEREEIGGWKRGPIEVDWPEGTSASSMIGRLEHPQKAGLVLIPFSKGTGKELRDAEIQYRPRWSIQRNLFSRWSLEGQVLNLAQLSGIDLSCSNLSGARMCGADMRGARFEHAALENADLTLANLTGANLTGANLKIADLQIANLMGANLEKTDLGGAKLAQAHLVGANLEGANLERANLEMADLRGANLEGANLVNTNLEGANLEGANLVNTNLEGANLDNAAGVPPPKPAGGRPGGRRGSSRGGGRGSR